MAITFSPWKPMLPTVVADAPASPGVYELATLVRTVVFIGAAPENLSEALSLHLHTPPSMHRPLGRLYFRVAPLEDPEPAQAGLLDAYRAGHAGALPAVQMSMPAPLPIAPHRHLKAV